MDAERQEKFARLLALSKVHEAQIKANPIPFLNEVAAENDRLRRAIEDALVTLSGADNFDLAIDAVPTLSPSIVQTVTLRNQKASDLLTAAIRGGEK